jgi:hypothetical protein
VGWSGSGRSDRLVLDIASSWHTRPHKCYPTYEKLNSASSRKFLRVTSTEAGRRSARYWGGVSRRSPFQFVLTADERQVLEARVRRPKAEQREVLRAQIVRAAARVRRTSRSPSGWASSRTPRLRGASAFQGGLAGLADQDRSNQAEIYLSVCRRKVLTPTTPPILARSSTACSGSSAAMSRPRFPFAWPFTRADLISCLTAWWGRTAAPGRLTSPARRLRRG